MTRPLWPNRLHKRPAACTEPASPPAHPPTSPALNAARPQELHSAAETVRPRLEELAGALGNYHLHSPDGWITSAGWVR
jgi:hypothetical protein